MSDVTTTSLAPILAAVADHLSGTPTTLPVGGRAVLGERYRTTVRLGRHELVVDEPSSIGGADEGPTPVELVIGSLAACQAITYRIWSERLGIPVDDVVVEVTATYDPGPLLGAASDSPASPTDVMVAVELRGPEPGRHDDLRAAVDAHCPVLALFGTRVQVATSLVA